MTHSPDGTTPQSPDALRADIERTRAELADTVDALTARLDVKSRAQARAEELAHDARTRAEELAHDSRAQAIGVGAAILALATVALMLWRKHR
jgi:ElaB/YqjD/DUF883 family membrane-anchored ribosome-binding protein